MTFSEYLQQSELKPGESIYMGGTGSIGYRGKQGEDKGFVTAGHVVERLNENIRLIDGGAVIGVSKSYQDGGKVDGAFVKITDSNYEGSNITKFGNITLNTSSVHPAVGAVINFEGNTFAKVIQGKIFSVNFSIAHYSDMLSAILDTATQGGDSGGIYYDTSNNVAGIHEGIISGSSQTIFTKIDNINSAFGLTRY